MEVLQSNWIWLIFIGLFLWMMVSQGGCCGAGKHGRGKRKEESHQR